jgi:hypothetical protein
MRAWKRLVAGEDDADRVASLDNRAGRYLGPLERSFEANRGTNYNAGIADKAAYCREANEQMLVCALLEDVAVLDRLDAILAVPGIGLYSIGPNDFAKVLAIPASPTIRKSSRQCRKSRAASARLGAGCNRTSCMGRGSAICCSMRVIVFCHRSVGERCSSIRYRLQTRRDGPAEACAARQSGGSLVDAFGAARNKVVQ